MSGAKTMTELSPEDKQRRLWLMAHLDLSGDTSPRKPSQDPGPRSKGTEDIQPGDRTDPTFTDQLPRIKEILGKLDRLKLPSDASPRQVETLQQLLEPARQQARDGKLDAAEKAIGPCETLFKQQVEAILARRARTERFKKIAPINSFTRGQGQRFRAADAKYLTAEKEDRVDDAELALQERESLQVTLLAEIETARKVRSQIASLTDPAEVLPAEVNQLKLLRDAVEDHLRNDLLNEAEEGLKALTSGIEGVKAQIDKDKQEGTRLAKALLDSIKLFAKELGEAGVPKLKVAVLSNAVTRHTKGAPVLNQSALIKACDGGAPTRQQALEMAKLNASLKQAVTEASGEITGSVGHARTSLSLIDQALSRAQSTINTLEPHNKLDYLPTLWSQWPSDKIPKPALSDLPGVPELDDLKDRHADLDQKRFEDAAQLEKDAGVGGKVIDWDAAEEAAQALANDADQARTDYYSVINIALYGLFDKALLDQTHELEAQRIRLDTALSEKKKTLPDIKKGLSKDDQRLLEQLMNQAGTDSQPSKVKTQLGTHVASVTKGLTESSRKVEDIRSSDGKAPEPVPEDPTVFEGDTYALVGQLSSKDLYVRFDDTVTSSSHYDKKYEEALSNGVIPSTGTGKAGIKNEPYGWVVKVTLHAANANAEIDNTMSPRASAGLKVSTGKTPAFYLNFDEWVARH